MLTSDDQERRATQEKILGSVVALSRVAEKDRVPFWQKVAYGVAGSTEILVGWIPQEILRPSSMSPLVWTPGFWE